MTFVIFCVLYGLTFFPAWYVLLKLIALSTSQGKIRGKFIVWFLLYQLIMALPYLYLLLYTPDSLSGLMKSVVVGILGTGLLLSILRFFFSKYVNAVLWFVYGYVYDGLMRFYPYIHLQDLVHDAMGTDSTMTVLDLGAGSGNQTILLADDAKQVVAVDGSVSMLGRLRRKIKRKSIKNITVYHKDTLEYLKSEASHSFDRIAVVNVLYTVTDRKLFWREAFRILKPGGKIIVTNSDKAGNSGLIKEHIKARGYFSLLRPKLIAVFVIDSLISEMSKTGHFQFIEEATIKAEVNDAGGKYKFLTRCYGDVNLLFEVTKN